MEAPLDAAEVRSYADRLLASRHEGSAAELVDLIAALEELKSTACAVQAEASVAFDARRRSEQAQAGVARRARRAEADRNVTVRPAPDTMAYLTGLMPVAQAVAVYAALRTEAQRARAAGDPRSLGQLMSDLLLAKVTGVSDTGDDGHAPAVPLTINLTLSDETLAGGHAPAVLSGDGVPGEVVPAEVARQLAGRAFAAEATVWFRRLYRNRLGRWVAMSSRQRLFPEGIAELLALQGEGICASPYCDAPVRHADHIRPVDDGGATSAANGQGLCVVCNHAKQAPGWRQQVVSSPRERPEVETVTPTGRRYTATAPAPPGWREPRFVRVGPGRYDLIA